MRREPNFFEGLLGTLVFFGIVFMGVMFINVASFVGAIVIVLELLQYYGVI